MQRLRAPLVDLVLQANQLTHLAVAHVVAIHISGLHNKRAPVGAILILIRDQIRVFQKAAICENGVHPAFAWITIENRNHLHAVAAFGRPPAARFVVVGFAKAFVAQTSGINDTFLVRELRPE